MTPYDPLTTSTTLEDDGPRWQATALPVISGVLIVPVAITVILIIDALQIDRRAAIALSEADRIAEETQSARVFFWIVVWISAAIVIMGGAAALLVIFGSIAYRSIDYVRAPRLLYYPQMRTASDLHPRLRVWGPRQETLTSPQSSMISEFVQDRRGQEIQNR